MFPTPGTTRSPRPSPASSPEGATAVTIEGTRHRAGVWNGEEVTSEYAVSFTIFLVCPPTDTDPTNTASQTETAGAGSCYVARLSELDNPLR